MPLPQLRDELALYAGPANADGSPSWLIYDPHRARYFQIGWGLFEIIRRWEVDNAQILIERVNDETTLALSEEDVSAAIKFLENHELLRASSERDTLRMLERHNSSRQTMLQWLIHNYLFFRIPLINPDAFLTATLPSVRFLAAKSFALLTLAVLASGLILVVRDWSNVVVLFRASLTIEGAMGYGVAVILAKLAHELGHAYVAKAYGCRVATMGVAFLVLYPVPYTDTNDAWTVRSRRGRLAIASAGMAAELYIAAWATFLFNFLPEGAVKSATMTLAVTTWVMSVVVNSSPIMRFDGYYILSDLWGIPNLHSRAFALGRWFLRETLFAIGDASPEPAARKQRILLIVFAFLVWVYRLVGFLGIAVLVYYFFVKIIGIVLFFVEIVWFIIMPVMRELNEWWRRRRVILSSSRTHLSAGALGLLVLVVAVPWSGRIDAPALLRSERISHIYPAIGAEVIEIFASEGEVKRKGEKLFALRSDSLEYQIRENAARIDFLDQQIKTSGFDDGLRSQAQFLREKLASAITERKGHMEQKKRLDIVAPFDGQVFDLLSDLRAGQSVGQRQKLASFREHQATVAIAFVAEEKLYRIADGQSAIFYPDTPTRSPISLQIRSVEKFSVRSMEYAVLASRFGGPIATLDKDKGLQPQSSIYKVIARPIEEMGALDAELRGTLHIKGAPESLAVKATRAALAVLVRESAM